jgi:hypothetical protein
MMDSARITNQSYWQDPSPPARWQQQPIAQQPAYPIAGYYKAKNQTLPTFALILGILSLPAICFFSGLWLGMPAMILGFFGMRNADLHPDEYTGKGMAIAGMVMGLITFLITMAVIFLALVA